MLEVELHFNSPFALLFGIPVFIKTFNAFLCIVPKDPTIIASTSENYFAVLLIRNDCSAVLKDLQFPLTSLHRRFQI